MNLPTLNISRRKDALGRGSRAFGLLLLGGLLSLALVGCSVQESALIKVAYVQDRIAVPAAARALTTRVNRVGTTRRLTKVGKSNRLQPVTAETTFLDVEGDFVLKTSKIGDGWVVVKSPEFDVAYSPVFIEDFGEVLSLGQLIPQTSVSLVAKTPGESLFVAFEEDWEPIFGEVDQVDLVGPTSFDLDTDAQAMHDDGSLVDLDPNTAGMQVSGDFAAGDGVWTLRATNFPAGQQQYGFFINKDTDIGLQRDPYEEGSDGNSLILVN